MVSYVFISFHLSMIFCICNDVAELHLFCQRFTLFKLLNRHFVHFQEVFKRYWKIKKIFNLTVLLRNKIHSTWDFFCKSLFHSFKGWLRFPFPLLHRKKEEVVSLLFAFLAFRLKATGISNNRYLSSYRCFQYV